jgi:hypothetical protein
MPVILTEPTEFDSVVSILGVTLNDFSYADIQSIGFLEQAENKVIKVLETQSGYGTTVPTIGEIMAGTSLATPADKINLQSAVIYRIAFLFGPGETAAVDTAQTIGPVSKDLGGIGQSWKDQMQEYLALCDQAIGDITGFKRWRTL